MTRNSKTVSVLRRTMLMFVLGTLVGVLLDRLFPLPVPTELEHSVEVVDATGERLRLYTTQDGYWRLPAWPAELDSRFLKLLLAYEDHRFYTHLGVDPLALGRALGQALTSGRFVSGGSTLTMQTVRLLQPRPRTLRTKLIEILRALQLERHLSKEQILGLYLTLAPYGGNLQGVRAASLFYFGKEPSFLTLAEAALLVALPQAPEARRPDRAPARAQAARAAVLQRLTAAGLIDRGEAARAALEPLPQGRRPTPRLAPHLSDRLRAAHPALSRLQTTLNGPLQHSIEALLRRHQGRQAAEITLATLVLDHRTGAVRAYVGSADYFATQVDMVRAIRSPGSTLKPFVYGLAFDAAMIHPETLIFDRPGAVQGYAPGNFDHRYQGEIRIREALRTSRNIPAIKVLERLGVETLLQRLSAVGVKLHLPKQVTHPGLPVVLGGVGIRLEDLVRLYGGLAMQGSMHDLHFLKFGRLGARNGSPSTGPQPAHTESSIVSPTAAWYLTDILIESPTPPGFVTDHRRIAFKTGTSYGFRDAWAVGYDANHTVGVWVGRPDNGYTANLSGLKSAVPVLFEIFDLLPDPGLLLRYGPPPGALLVQNEALPVSLRHFDMPLELEPLRPIDGGRLRILYPPGNVLVELTGGPNASLHLETRGGQAPLYLLVNGRPVAHSDDRHVLNWVPETDGAVQLTVLDARGRSDQVRVQVRHTGGSL